MADLALKTIFSNRTSPYSRQVGGHRHIWTKCHCLGICMTNQHIKKSSVIKPRSQTSCNQTLLAEQATYWPSYPQTNHYQQTKPTCPQTKHQLNKLPTKLANNQWLPINPPTRPANQPEYLHTFNGLHFLLDEQLIDRGQVLQPRWTVDRSGLNRDRGWSPSCWGRRLLTTWTHKTLVIFTVMMHIILMSSWCVSCGFSMSLN